MIVDQIKAKSLDQDELLKTALMDCVEAVAELTMIGRSMPAAISELNVLKRRLRTEKAQRLADGRTCGFDMILNVCRDDRLYVRAMTDHVMVLDRALSKLPAREAIVRMVELSAVIEKARQS